MAKTERALDNKDTTGDGRIIGPFTVTKALRDAAITLDRTGFSDSSISFFLRAEYRQSAKDSWMLWCGFSTDGGTTTGPSSISTSYLPPVGSEVRVLVRTNGATVKQVLSLVEVE